MKCPPRVGDLPREELLQRAEETIRRYGRGASIHFKFTCENCGTRCTLEEPKVMYEEGECFKCGHKTKIEYGGFMLELDLV